jgi:hypothetical protein
MPRPTTIPLCRRASGRWVWGLASGLGSQHGGAVGRSVDDAACQVRETGVGVTGVPAEPVERLVHGEVAAFGEDSFGLFDHDATGERVLELLSEHLAVADRAFLQDRDRGYVGERLADAGVGVVEAAGTGTEQVDRADHLVA